MTVTVNGVTSSNLTTSTDFVDVTGTGVDTVFGEVSATPGLSTLTNGDVINGNGNTVLRVVAGNGSLNVPPVPLPTMPVFELNDVNKVDFVAPNVGKSEFDASLWHDVHVVKLSTFVDAATVSVENLNVEDKLRVAVGAQFSNNLIVSGKIGDLNYDINVSNSDLATDGLNASFRISDGNIFLKGGAGDNVTAALSQTAVIATGDATAGDLLLGDITLRHGGPDSAGFGDLSLNIYNTASVSVGAGNATVGDTVIGDIDMDLGGNEFTPFLSIMAAANAAGAGDATVGDLTIGDIDMKLGAEFDYMTFYIYHSATAATGNATVGDLIIGNLNLTAATGVSYADYWFFYHNAYALKSGGATVGDTVIGDITYNLGPNANSNGYASLTASAYGSNGDAVAGDFSVGDINIVGVDSTASSPSVNLIFEHEAYAAMSGAATNGSATVGDMTIGDISIVGGTNFNVEGITITHVAYVGHSDGIATAGDTSIGDIDMVTGRSGNLAFDLSVTARQNVTTKQFYGGSHVGRVVVGDVRLEAGFNGDIEFSNSVSAEHGMVDGYKIGDMTVTTGDSAAVSILQYVYGSSIGRVALGDLDMNIGNNGEVSNYYNYFSATGTAAGTGNIRRLDIGNIDLQVGDGATVDDVSYYAYAKNNIGAITIGDINLNATGAGTYSVTGTFSALHKVGSVTVGDINLYAEGTGGQGTLNFQFVGADGLAVKKGLTFGDVNVLGRENGSFDVSLSLSSTSGDIGDVTLGDINLKAVDSASIDFVLAVTGSNKAGQTAGDITVGDVNLIGRADGTSISLTMTIKATSWDTVGNINIGDVRIVTHRGDVANAGDEATIDFNITLQGEGDGDINIGDVVFRNLEPDVDPTATEYNSAGIDISATGGAHDVTIGNIKVIGGFKNVDGSPNDALDDLSSILDITTTGKITLGNVDYSRYLDDATIGDSGHTWHGMGIIKAAQGDTTIYETEEQNLIYLGDGNDTVDFNTTQSTDMTDATKIDTIFNFTHIKDTLDFGTAVTGSNFFRTGGYASYGDFVTAAKASIASDTDVFLATVGSDSFIGVDTNNDKVMDWVVKVAGVTNLDYGDFTI